MSRGRQTLLLSAWCGSVAVLASCGSGAIGPPSVEPETPESLSELSPDLLGSQRLFRVRYSGPEGSGSLRLVLRLSDRRHFQLLAADALGRSLWTLEVDGVGTRLVDHRRRVHCDSGVELRIAEATLGSFDLAALPKVMLGRLPTDVDEGLRSGRDRLEFVDGRQRRWSARVRDGRLESWTMWGQGQPLIWWIPRGKGGILSHREGSQFRWRETVVEPLEGDLEPLVPPGSYRRVECDEEDLPQLRED